MELAETFWTSRTRLSAPPTTTGEAGSSKCEWCGGRGYVRYMQRYRRRPGARWDDEPEVIEEVFIPPGTPDMYVRRDYPYPTWADTSADCDCQKPLLAEQRLARILGQPGMPEETFTFDEFEGYPHAAEALAFARRFAQSDALLDESGIERTGLILLGPTGTGKTSLAKAVFLIRIKAGQTGAWLKFIRLVELVKATYQDGYSGPSKAAIIETLMYSRFLLLDELGSLTQKGLYWEDLIQAVYQVFDHRLAKRLPTLVTSNLDEDELIDQFGMPVASRIAGLCHGVAMRGGDFRRKRATA